MKIKAIQISGFGKWSDVTFDSLADWQVFVGQNEAGKSTLKAFILGVFFGFPKGKKGKVQLYEPRSGAKYGGSIDISCQKGDFRISRFGRTKTELTVTALETGLEMPNPDKFLEELFSPLTEEDFLQIYSFDETELAAVSKLAESDLEQTLLSFTKPQAQRFLAWAKEGDDAANDAFGKTKTSKRPLNLEVQKYAELAQKEAEKQGDLNEYYQAEKAVAELQEKLAAAKQERLKAEENYKHAVDRVDAWQIYKQNRTEPADFASSHCLPMMDWRPDYDLCLNAEAEINWLNEQIETNEAKLQELQTTLKNTSNQRDLGDLKLAAEKLSDNLDTVLRLNQELGQAETDFGRRIPEPLEKREKTILEKGTSGFWAVNISAVLTVGAFFLSLALGLVMACAFLAILVYFYLENLREKNILLRFAPLNKLEVLAQNDYFQKIADKASERRAANDRQAELTDNLLKALTQAGFEVQAKALQFGSSQRVLQGAQQLLHSDQDGGQSRLYLRLEEAIENQKAFVEKRALAEKEMGDSLRIHGFERLQDFKDFVALQRKNQVSQETRDLAKEQVGEALWSEIERIEDECSGFEEETESRIKNEAFTNEIILKEQQKKEDELQEALNDARVQLSYLAGDESLAEISQQLENERAHLKEAFSDYLAKKLLLPVMNQAFLGKQDSLEEDVLSQAGAYLAQLFEGDYEKIELEDGQLYLSGKASSRFAIHELSAGAKDLVYLSMRMALATALQLKERFPLLVDDAFVHLDEEKKGRALALLQEVAFDQQVLFWTFDSTLLDQKSVNLNQFV